MVTTRKEIRLIHLNRYALKSRLLLSTVVLISMLFSSMPAFSQSGFSNIGSFFNKEKHEKETNFNNVLTIKEILVEGNRLISDESILSVIESMIGAKFEKDKIINDLEIIDKLGYFIRDSIQANPEPTEEGILLKIRIEENNPITQVYISGNKLIQTEELLASCQCLVGMPESLTRISEVLNQLETQYKEKGFILARVSDISLEPDGTLTIYLNEGIIDNVVIKGNNKTKEKYIRRFLPNLVSEEPYNEILLVQDFRALQGTGLFEDIKRTLTPSQNDPSKYDLNVELEEKRSTSFGFGGGLNTVNGVFANLGFTNNNIFGEGKQASINTQFGTGILANALVNQRFLADQKTIQLEAKYHDPSFLNTKNALTLFAHGYTFNSYLVDLAQEKNISAGASVLRPLGMNFYGGLDFSGEAVSIKDYGSSALDFLTNQIVNVENGKYLDELTEKGAFNPGQTIGDHLSSVKKENAKELAKEIREYQTRGGQYINIGPSFVYDTRDNQINPRRGWNSKINLGQAIGSSSFTKLGVDLRKYVPVGQKTTLAFNLQGASAILGRDNIPVYSQFKAGGYYGVRGYRSFSDLGIGTRSLLASAELRTPLLDSISVLQNNQFAKDLKLVFFSDLGYVDGNNNINRLFNRLTLASSAGIGLRANIPMFGPVRIDYGIPLVKSLWKSNNLLGRFNIGFADRF